ncbi:relaxase/mobilization nuclease domain-containing protein, partial [Lactobacillus sp. LC28-10]
MATIAKITNGASAASALNYALGKDKELHNDTKQWLEDNRLERPPELTNCRAVAVGGTNGIDISIANEQFKIVQQAFNQTARRNQVLRITQSFALNELDPTNTRDWQRANDLGCELAEKLYPDYQTAVYTHLDGQNHILHNHIII